MLHLSKANLSDIYIIGAIETELYSHSCRALGHGRRLTFTCVLVLSGWTTKAKSLVEKRLYTFRET